MNRVQMIKDRLTAALSPTTLEVIDDADKHVGHVGSQSGAGHFSVRIASAAFSGKTRVQSHQLVYQALNDMMHADIHALNIVIL